MIPSLKFAVIGCGGIGNVHRACVAELESQGLAHLVAVADPYPAKFPLEAAALADHGKRWYLDYREMLRREELDVVVIAAPIHLHFEMALACLEAGVRILLEKPPVPLSAQLEKLISLDPHGSVWTSFQMVHTNPVQQAKALILAGQLGEVRCIRVSGFWSRKSTYYQRASWAGKLVQQGSVVFDGPATNALAHLIHNTMFLGTNEPGFTTPDRVEAEFYRIRPIESYDLLSLRARLASGVQFTAAFTHATHHSRPFCLEVTGTRGTVRIEEGVHEAISALPVPTLPRETALNPFQMLYHDFIGALMEDKPSPRTLLGDARGYVQITNGALVSSGGIRDVPLPFIDTSGHGVETSYSVPGLDMLLAEAVRSDRLISEMNVPWARPCAQVDCAAGLDAAPLMLQPRVAEEAAAA